MRNLYSLLFMALLFSTILKAGHEFGGIIVRYESMAHVHNNPNQYLVQVYAVFATQAVAPPPSYSISINSSCFPNSSISLPKIGTLYNLYSVDYCTPGAAGGYYKGYSLYQDTVILPGKCADYEFVYSGGFGRYSTYANITNNFTGTPYYSASLNNTISPASSPSFDPNDLVQSFCVNKPVTLYGFNDPDGDSLYFQSSAPKILIGGVLSTYSYQPGYSSTNPLNSPVGFILDPNTGIVQTAVSTQGTFMITIDYEKYRDDSLGIPVQIGSGQYLYEVIGSTNCIVPNPEIKIPASGGNIVPCGSKLIQVACTRKLAVSTIASDGSDFLVSDQNGPLVVNSANALSDTIVEIELSQSVSPGALISVVADTGTDGNVMISICGNHIDPYSDTLSFQVGPAVNSAQALFNYGQQFLSVNFDASLSTGDSLFWDFGDGSTASGVTNPTHSYPSNGTYNVLLHSMDKCGSEDSLYQLVQVCDSLRGRFNFNVNGKTVVFVAVAVGADSVLWSFGDGNTSSGDSVLHTYNSNGSYTVQMTAINACGDTVTIIDTVNTCLLPQSSFVFTIVGTGGNGMTIDFDGSASQQASSWLWEFGDGNTNSTSLTPRHTYVIPSLNYYVELHIMNDCGDTASYGYALSQFDQQEIKFGYDVYPNPVTDVLFISQSASADKISLIQLLDTKGAVMMETMPDSSQDKIDLHMSGLNPGVYLVRIVTDTSVIVEPIMH